MNPVAVNIMNQKAPNGEFLRPQCRYGTQLQSLQNQSADAIIQGSPSRFTADQVSGNLDYRFQREGPLGGEVLFPA